MKKNLLSFLLFSSPPGLKVYLKGPILKSSEISKLPPWNSKAARFNLTVRHIMCSLLYYSDPHNAAVLVLYWQNNNDPHVVLRGQKYQESGNLCNAGWYIDPHISTLWISWTELLRDWQMSQEAVLCVMWCNVLPWTKAASVGCVLWYTRYPELSEGALTTPCASLF